ncbi:MAG TPA: Uma2 family endonuclease [Thermoanaerobaculia bacterium]|jgi:Uma2 family endonuclease|nr:Uma2 family endonuclease [Thermoanaerobaculia bacterium]
MNSPAVIFEESLRVPAEVHDLQAFRRWAFSPDFPEAGRIDFLSGDVEVDMSPEDLHTHGRAKMAVSRVLDELVEAADLGEVFVDRSRVTSSAGNLSVEPDVVVVLWQSLESGRVRYVPDAQGRPGRSREIEGAPDLVVEIVSDSSVGKDRRRLPRRYAAAGVRELWLVDARGDELAFEIHSLAGDTFERVTADPDGWTASRVLSQSFRLLRQRTRLGTWRYRLERRT